MREARVSWPCRALCGRTPATSEKKIIRSQICIKTFFCRSFVLEVENCSHEVYFGRFYSKRDQKKSKFLSGKFLQEQHLEGG